MICALDVRRQQLAHRLQRFFHVLELLDLDAEQGVDDRQVVGRIRKPDLGVGVEGLQGLLVLAFNLGNDVVRTLNRSERN